MTSFVNQCPCISPKSIISTTMNIFLPSCFYSYKSITRHICISTTDIPIFLVDKKHVDFFGWINTIVFYFTIR